MTSIITQDGNCLITDPEVGTISRRTREEAEAELRRLKTLRERSDGGLNIITKHTEIQTGGLHEIPQLHQPTSPH